MRRLRDIGLPLLITTLVAGAPLTACGAGAAPAPTVRSSATTDGADDGVSGSGVVATLPTTSDSFCDGWFDYALTVRLLVTLTLDSSSAGVQRLAEVELIAAASMEEAVGTIGEHWPADLVGERSTVLVDVVGPYLRRAQKALAALAGAGLSADQIAELRLAWRDVLAAAARMPTAGAGVWLERAVVPADLHGAVTAAAASFAAGVTAFGDDPTLPDRMSLVDPSSTPRTDGFLAAQCAAAAAVASGLEF
ncbi:MAG: hypothetical protein ACO3C1_09800 [Ilumatobacteraceae bacterium]